MKYLLLILCLVTCIFCATFSQQSKEYVAVNVTVESGETMEEIIYELKEIYNDKRDWRVIYDEAKRDNDLGRWIYPGQQLVLKMVVDKDK